MTLLTRRCFLKSSGLVPLCGMAFGAMPSFLARAAMTNRRGGKKILIVVFQRGAADGLNIVVPHGEPGYYAMRPSIHIPRPRASDPETAMDLDGFFGLHPALKPLKPLYDAGHLAMVHAAGSPDNTRSHFDAQDCMESGTPGIKSTADGWLNRSLQAQEAPGASPPEAIEGIARKSPWRASPLRAVALGPYLPRSLAGSTPAVAISNLNEFVIRAGATTPVVASSFEEMYARTVDTVLHGSGQETFEAMDLLRRSDVANVPRANGAVYPRGPFGSSLRQIAQLVKAKVGLEAAFAEVGGWDHHVNEGSVQGQLANRLAEFGQALRALYQDLGDRVEDVVIVTMSEFGRTARENGNRGTDHGHANVMFVLGGPVKGGKVYGQWPGLGREQLYEGRDLALTTDFRTVLCEILSKHLGNPNLGFVFPGFSADAASFRNLLRG